MCSFEKVTQNIHENQQAKSRANSITHNTLKKNFVLCLFLATFKEQVDNVKLVELANQLYFENEHRFYIFGKFKIRDFLR